MKKVIVIGAGPAGMISAYFASREGAEVILLEKNKMVGRKLRITGKGRCNITNASDIEDIISNIYNSGNFMYSSLYSFTNDDIVELLNKYGLDTKTERGNRVFPKSDRAIDVVNTFKKIIDKKGISLRLNSCVESILVVDSKIKGVKLKGGKKIYSDSVIIATGGKSYPLTGSTGDGYVFAKICGHKITTLRPALVGLSTIEKPKSEMVGLKLRNIGLKLYRQDKLVYTDFGELEFRDYGIDGPTVKSASCHINSPDAYRVVIDLKPALDEKKLDKRIQRDFMKKNNKNFSDSLDELIAKKLIPYIIEKIDIDPKKMVHQISRAERKNLVNFIKNFEFIIEAPRPLDEAIVTSGGLDIREIDPHSMESKLVRGLFFAGEVIDVDGYTGGYNLQIAYSTGYLAGVNSCK